MNIKMPRKGDVWTNRNDERRYVINSIFQCRVRGSGYYDIVWTEESTGKILEGRFWRDEEQFILDIPGVGQTHCQKAGLPRWTPVGDLIPPGCTSSDVLTRLESHRACAVSVRYVG